MINQQMFMVGGSGRKKPRWLFFCRIAGRIHPLLFSEFPTSNHTPLSKYQV
ncbi:hypothetical protein [Aneurinibacillus migulanus]|uniref:hypothetical protein n=1 Tax=Aneurinibacillus migulanus TaxID=47500 RepID=UPI001F3DD3A1|nr:hypothetical protein [Aneurinibacillus migulanus]